MYIPFLGLRRYSIKYHTKADKKHCWQFMACSVSF